MDLGGGVKRRRPASPPAEGQEVPPQSQAPPQSPTHPGGPDMQTDDAANFGQWNLVQYGRPRGRTPPLSSSPSTFTPKLGSRFEILQTDEDLVSQQEPSQPAVEKVLMGNNRSNNAPTRGRGGGSRGKAAARTPTASRVAKAGKGCGAGVARHPMA